MILENNFGSSPWHGTPVVGCAAADTDNNKGIASIGFNSKVVFSSRWANNNEVLRLAQIPGVRVINLSWINSCNPTVTQETLYEEIRDVYNVVVVAGAGNRSHHCGENAYVYPASYESVVSVTSVGHRNDYGYVSPQHGPNNWKDVHEEVIGDPNSTHHHNDRVDICAPGYNVKSTQMGDNYGGVWGTSFAAPIVAGVCALVASVNPCLTADDIAQIVLNSADASIYNIPENSPYIGLLGTGRVDAYAAVLMALDGTGGDVTIDQNKVIDNLFVSGDLIIENGAKVNVSGTLSLGSESIIHIEAGSELSVPGTIKMGEMGQIFVKRGAEMIVDGGLITTHDCADKWRRIVVEGNINEEQQIPGFVTNDHKNGVLYLNNATLENGVKLISMHPTYLGWPTYSEYYGGHVTAKNTVFRNANRVAGFMQYFRQDQSKFIDCQISNVRTGMTHWSNFGTIYEGNSFEDCKNEAIFTYDAAIIVRNGNTFDNSGHTEFDQAGIHLFHTFPNINASVIGGENPSHAPNVFLGGFYGLFSEAGAPLVNDIEVKKNIFIGGDRAIEFRGVSRHSIKENTINGATWGTTFISNSEYFNTVFDNQFSGNGVGLFSFFLNPGLDFLSNCFDYSTQRDVRIHNGHILPVIGNQVTAASNIFSESLSSRRITRSSSQGYLIPQYLIEMGTPSNHRLVPLNYEGNVFTSSDTDFGSCSHSQGAIVNPYQCNLPTTKVTLIAYIEDLDDDISDLETDLESTISYSQQWIEIQSSIQNAKRCLQKAKLLLLQFGLEGSPTEINDLITYFSSDKFLYKTHLLGVLIAREDYNLGRTYMNSLTTSSKEESDFVFAQNLNLDRLENHEFVPDSIDLGTLYENGYSTAPLAAYSRSLYHYFTGVKIDLGLIDTVDYNESRLGQVDPIDNPNDFKFFPNPFGGVVNFEYRSEVDLRIKVLNTLGQVISLTDIQKGEGVKEMDFTGTSEGMMYVVIEDKKTGDVIHVGKLVNQ